jgi:PAS domain S-box-containing protein
MSDDIKEKKEIIVNGGNIGAYIRSMDWSNHSIGRMEHWPQPLKTTLSLLLNSRLPMFLFWGEDLICFYNDAYRPSLGNEGKHPKAIGARGEDVWPEIWSAIKPQIDQVLAGGEAVWQEDVLLPIHRNGQIEDVYWTYSYSPVYDSSPQPLGVFVAVSETTEKVYGQRRLAESESNFRQLIMDAPVGITLLKGKELKVELANDLYLEIVGREREAFVGFPIFNVLPEAKSQGFQTILEQVITTDTPHFASEQELKIMRRKRQETIYVNYTYQPVHDASGQVNGVLAVVVDVTEMVNLRLQVEDLVKQRTVELQKANIQLARSNMDLEQFAYVASHDLQEPLRKIMAFGDLLKNRLTLGAGEQDLFNRMYSAVHRMQRLIDDLLTFSRVSIQGKNEVMDTNKLLSEVQVDLETAIREKRARITSEELLPIEGDPVQIRQLFQNLLSNAIKFSRKDIPPEVRINSNLLIGMDSGFDVPEKQKKKLFQLITVSDNGIGFEQQYAEKIFKVFQRLHGLSEYKGTGVGLSIVQKVVENHQGYVKAESDLGSGATFKILLPYNHLRS